MTIRTFYDIVREIDRCEHGRHAADPCFGCPDGNKGNQFLVPGARIGTTLYGEAIVVPPWDKRYEIEAWVVKT